MRVLIATSNPGKLRDFAAAAADDRIEVAGLPGIDSLPAPVEDQPTFELNARKKAEHYSRCAPGELILADDSGLEVDALAGAPGVHSARYAVVAEVLRPPAPGDRIAENTPDAENNARLLRELKEVPDDRRTAHFVCWIAVARDGATVATFRGTAEGRILREPRGAHGFGYDPLFFSPQVGKTFADLAPEEKARVSHRGQAFRKFLRWATERI